MRAISEAKDKFSLDKSSKKIDLNKLNELDQDFSKLSSRATKALRWVDVAE